VALLAPFDRPLAVRLLGETTRVKPAPQVPPLGAPVEPCSELPMARGTRLEIARFLAYALLTDVGSVRGVLPELEASVDEGVVVWSPCVSTRSRTELVAALLDGDDAITEVAVSILGASINDTTVYVEWHLQGQFNNAGFLNDDVLVEASGGLVQASGVIVVVFRNNRATHIRCYYDGLGLLEQVVRPPLT
jgi:hypothetical protein